MLSSAAGAIVTVGAFLVFTDARLSAFYNSVYAQSGRVFAAALLVILVSDVVISAFDGQQEARKHVLIAGATCLVILVHTAATLADHFRARRAAARVVSGGQTVDGAGSA